PYFSGITNMTPPDAIASQVWGHCQHRTNWFFAWHRLYLYYFEQVLQSAANDPTLRLPYWDYTNTSNLAMPAAYTSPTYVNAKGETVPNPLYEERRYPGWNTPTSNSLDPADTDIDDPLKDKTFFDVSVAGDGFQGGIEFNVHANVQLDAALKPVARDRHVEEGLVFQRIIDVRVRRIEAVGRRSVPTRIAPLLVQRVRHGLSFGVHVGGRGVGSRHREIGGVRVVPVGQAKRRIVRGALENLFEVVEVQPVPGEKPIGSVLAMPPDLARDRIRRGHVGDAREVRQEALVTARGLELGDRLLDRPEDGGRAEIPVHRPPVLPTGAIQSARRVGGVAGFHHRDGVPEALDTSRILGKRLPIHPGGLLRQHLTAGDCDRQRVGSCSLQRSHDLSPFG